jgi:hypothetical protein
VGCDGCERCEGCERCDRCEGCDRCDGCEGCERCDRCEGCDRCDGCERCERCTPSDRENRHGGAEVRVRRVEKFDYERVPFERFLHDAALDAEATAVNQANFAEPRGVGGADVLVDNRPDVRGQEGMEIEATFDRDFRSAPSLQF